MDWQNLPYQLLLGIGAVVTALLGGLAWRRRAVPGALPFGLVMLAVCWWSLGYALELASADLETKVLWASLEYPGIVTVIAAWLAFSLAYSGRERWLTRRTLALLSIEPLAVLALVWTNPTHHLFWASVRLDAGGPFPSLDITHGPAFWLHTAYSYLLLLAATFLLVRAPRAEARTYRGQANSLLVAALIPWAGNALFVSGLSPFDLTPLAFTLTGLAVAWGVSRFQLLDLAPIAKEAVFASMQDAVLVLDAQGRIVDLNPAAQALFREGASGVIGQPIAQTLASWTGLNGSPGDLAQGGTEIVLGEGDQRQVFDPRDTPLSDRNGKPTGRVITLRDITLRVQAEAELRRHREHLEELVAERATEVQRANRAYKMISAGNHAMLRAADETALLQGVCRAIVEVGGYRLAWVGLAEQDEARTVRVVARAGHEAGYLDALDLTWTDTEAGRGPSGAAIRSGQPSVAPHIAADPAFAARRKEALERGYASAVALPLLDGGEAFGALTVYAGDPDAFGEQEMALLVEMAGDLAYGLKALRTRAEREQARQALQVSEARLRSTLDNMLEGCQTIGFDWRYLYINEAAAQHGRQAREDLLGRTMMECYPGIEDTEMFAVLRRCMEDRTPQRMDNQFTYPDGSQSWFELSIEPVPEGIFILSLDVTQRKRAEEELRQLNQSLELRVLERTEELRRTSVRTEAIVNSVGEALMLVNIDGRLEQVNPAFEAQTGYTAREAGFRHHQDLLLDEGMPRGVFHESTAAMRAGQGWRGEMPMQRKDGTAYEAAVTITPLRDQQGEVVAFVGALRDISERKELERMQAAFVSNVSHELRTPITGLMLHLGLLERAVSSEVRERYLPTLKRETERLNRIIEDVLRLSRLDQGRVVMELAPVDLNAMVEEYVADRQLLAEERGLTLSFEGQDLPGVEADTGLLGQVATILLTNALHYTPEGGWVAVRTLVERQGSKAWVGFSVSDNGLGIPPDEQGKLFQRFFRGNVGRASEAPGTGLGLAIAREIMGRHRGRIEVESQGVMGEGATFRVWLPVQG